MIPVSTLYDEYIDRRKLTEQKNPFEYIVPSPLKRGRNNYWRPSPSCSLNTGNRRIIISFKPRLGQSMLNDPPVEKLSVLCSTSAKWHIVAKFFISWLKCYANAWKAITRL